MDAYPATQLGVPRWSLPIFGALNYGVPVVERNQSSLESCLRVRGARVTNAEKSMEPAIGALRADKVVALRCFLVAGNLFSSNGVHSETYSVTPSHCAIFVEFKNLSFFENHNVSVASFRVRSVAPLAEIRESHSGLGKQTHSKPQQHQENFSRCRHGTEEKQGLPDGKMLFLSSAKHETNIL